MISFLDLFKWDRFVATSFIELLFWLLAAIAVLFGVSGLIGGITLASVDPAGGLLAIAVSIIGGFAGIVAARVACEAVIMLFRVNENLMDIRDNLGAIERHAPVPAAAPLAAVAPVAPELSFAEVLEVALSEPMDVGPIGAGEGRRGDTRSAEARSAETSSLEARLADIRARRESVSATARAAEPAPAVSRPPAASAGTKAHLEEPAAPAWVAPPHVEPSVDGKPAEARSAAPDVRPATGPRIAEARQAESRKVEARKPVAKDETPAAERKPADPASGTPPVAEPRPAGAKSKDAATEDAKAVAEKLVDDASKVLAREAEATVDAAAPAKSKAHDAA
ncbi:DUF4282 domain-containing protein [Kaistia granuli]|uniref:DUF4282 domain-containing protein n=1 Tax=Kaistia granuli TaxID=363259 RepID=UPI000370DC0E|nr:DUF4282 domain-containing protein [Kaistia granuli]